MFLYIGPEHDMKDAGLRGGHNSGHMNVDVPAGEIDDCRGVPGVNVDDCRRLTVADD